MKKISEFDNQGCYSYSKIWAVTIPILLSMLMEHIIGLTDTAFLGRVSEVALGASALGSVYCLAFFVLGFGFSFGAQILIARRNGEKNFSKIGQIWYASLFFLILLALGLIVAIRYFSPQMLSLMVKSSNICDATVQYLDYRAYGLLFAFIMAIFRAFYVGIAQTKILTYSSIVMVLSNIILNYALIFGKFGLPEMGIAGAALASSIAEGIAMLYYIGYTLKAIDLKKYGFYSFSAFFKLNILMFETELLPTLSRACRISGEKIITRIISKLPNDKLKRYLLASISKRETTKYTAASKITPLTS